jgi:ATP-dependent DNA helicase 2 subunit 2
MAGKEATVYVLDLGATMGEWNNGRVESDLDYGMRYIWDKIANTMAANRVTLTVGVVGFRTDETNNMLAADNEEEYANISVLKEMGPISIPDLKDLQEKSRPSETSDGDAVSAIAVAAQMLRKHTELKSGKPGKYKRKIVLLTDGQGLISDEDLALVAEGLNESGYDIELVVMYIYP